MDIIPAHAELISPSEFEKAVTELDTLETMPTAAQRILSITADGEAAVDDVYDLVSADPSLAAGAMRIASSAAYGGRSAATLRDALVRLGISEIRKFVLAQSLMGKGATTNAFHRTFWEYSLKCAAISEALVHTLGIRGIDDPFLCGLLHDFGILVLSRLRGKDYRTLVGTPGEVEQIDRERDRYGFAHTDLGSMVAASWNLFDSLEHVMQFHHAPREAAALGLDPIVVRTVEIVAIAHEYAVRGEDSDRIDGLSSELSLDGKKLARGYERGIQRFERLYAGMLNDNT